MTKKKGAPSDAPNYHQEKFNTDPSDFLDPEVRPDGKRLEGAESVDFASILGNLPPGKLSQDHSAMLRSSSISEYSIKERGYRTLDDTDKNRTLLKSLGFSQSQINLPALLIPLHDPIGTIAGCQIRPDNPRLREGKSVKYEAPFHARNILDVNPTATHRINDPKQTLFLTEGTKKGDALVSKGHAAIALSGVWGWIGKNDQSGSSALASWRDIPLKGRQVRIVFDSDAAVNPKVQQAELALTQYLESKGADVVILRIPPGENGEKQGIDDYLYAGGQIENLQIVRPDNQAKASSVGDELSIAECLDDGTNLVFSLQRFWRFDEREGVWTELPDEAVKRALQIVCRENQIPVKDSLIRGAFGSAKARFFRQVEFDRTDRRSIPAANGILRYGSGKWTLNPYKREDFRRIRLPVTYNPEATCPRFERFLEEVFDGTPDIKERVRLVLEFLALSMTASTEYEKALMLVGSGGNGKSVLVRVLEAMVGSRNRSAVQLKQLENRFQRAHLDGKIINILTELSEGADVPDAEVKAIISGEPITAEHKLKPPFEFYPVCKLWLLTNHLPSVRDLSDGTFRRFSIITFPNRFDDKPTRDTSLSEKLAAESSGVLNYCLRALAGVYERGSLTEPKSSREAVDSWRRDSDQVAAFVEEEMILEPGASIASKEAYSIYQEWAKESGIRKLLGRKNFTLRLSNMGVVPSKGTGGTRLLHGLRRA
jgi:putative DNA primase/helicase